jgi:hypothetical protein
LDEDGWDNIPTYHQYSFVFDDKTTFPFLLLNLSNGFYDGWLETHYTNHCNIEKNKLVIIVGLPGSGKTIFSKKYYKNYICYDDELFNLYKIKKDLYDYKKVIVVSATFCNVCNYLNFIEKLNLKNDENIITVCFNSDLKQSIKNIKTRGGDNILSFIKSAKSLDTYYDENNDKYINRENISTYF